MGNGAVMLFSLYNPDGGVIRSIRSLPRAPVVPRLETMYRKPWEKSSNTGYACNFKKIVKAS